MSRVVCKGSKERRWQTGICKAAAWTVVGMFGMAVPLYSAGWLRVLAEPEEVIVRMEQRFQQQLEALESYSGLRRYAIAHPLLSEETYWVVEECFSAPEEKRFEVLAEGGSGAVQKRVFGRLLQVERETAREAVRPQVDLSRENYQFLYLGFDASSNSYRFQAVPRGENEYLLRGTIWVDAEDFAVKRIEGEPASDHSILIKRVRFVHEFAKFGEFWFPVRHRSVTELRFLGTATLQIDYTGYQWQARSGGEGNRAVAERTRASERKAEFPGETP